MGLAQSQASVTYAPSNNRIDAVFRLVLLLVWTWTVWPIISAIGLIGGLFLFIVDFISQLFSGGQGLSTSGTGGGMFGRWAYRLFLWPLGQLSYIVLGGMLPVLP